MNEPAPQPAPPRRRRWPWVLGGLLLVLGAVLLFGAPALLSSAAVRESLEAEAGRVLGRPVSFSGLDVRLLPSPRLLLRGLTVGNPAGFSGVSLVTAGELEAGISWSSLLGRRIRIHRLSFRGVEVAVERLPDGRTNLDGLTLDLPPAGGGAGLLASASPPPGVSLEISRILLEEIRVRLDDRLTGLTALLEGLSLDARVEDLPLSGGSLDILQKADLGGLLKVRMASTEGVRLQGLDCVFSLRDGVAALASGTSALNDGVLAFSASADVQEAGHPAWRLRLDLGGNRLTSELGRRWLGPFLALFSGLDLEGRVEKGVLELAWKGTTRGELNASLAGKGSLAFSLEAFDLSKYRKFSRLDRLFAGESLKFGALSADFTAGNGTVSNEVRLMGQDTGVELSGTLRLEGHAIDYWLKPVGRLKRLVGERAIPIGGTLEDPDIKEEDLLKQEVQEKVEEKFQEILEDKLKGLLP